MPLLNISNQVASVDSRITSVESKVNGVTQVVAFGYKYIGRGIQGTSEGEITIKSGTKIQECLQLSQGRWLNDRTWNGVIWDMNDGRCAIKKNDRGHTSAGFPEYLHFRAE